MKQEIVLCGVGGQGILTIAKVISMVAAAKGMSVKQAEVHGMSQRGGAVHAHVRISSEQLHSDLICQGRADLILSVEPLEALRYADFLRSGGTVVSGTSALPNIPNYPAVERILDRIAEFPNHVLLDLERLGRAAGSSRSANMVALGAASTLLPFDPHDVATAILVYFESKGPKVQQDNLRAFRFGRNAATAYKEGIRSGGTHRSLRQWIETLDPKFLADEEPPEVSVQALEVDETVLSGAEAHAFEQALTMAHQGGRRQLFEHEVYALVELVGAISPPIHRFIAKGDLPTRDDLAKFPGDRVVLKVVSPDIVHKSDVGAVVFVPKQVDAVRREIDRLLALEGSGAHIEGFLLVEFVEPEGQGFGSELFVGIRATREFGPILAAGLGGLQMEYFASRLVPGAAVAMAAALETDAETFFEMFKNTAAYDVLAGRVRGHRRVVSDGELLRCFRSFISIARHFCVDRGETAPDIGELEVNPFTFRQNRMIPLDGRGVMRTVVPKRASRPLDKVQRLLEPRSVGIIGVSEKSLNFGRIILQNTLKGGFPAASLKVVKPGATTIDGASCVPSIADLPNPTDLLVVAAPAPQLPGIIREATAAGHIGAVILIPGGVGETPGSEVLHQDVAEAVAEARATDGPVFVGPNCMGVLSRPGKIDTFFIPEERLGKDWDLPARPLAIVSQSGAFAVSRLSKLGFLRPVAAVSIGNQIDVTISDVVKSVCARDDVKVVAVYVEGFENHDGLEFVRAAKEAKAAGKTVILYKAGRNEAGRSAAAGHTASVAGDHDVCMAAASRAGVLVTETIAEFESLVELATLLDGKDPGTGSVFALTNAGMEAVAMADHSGHGAKLVPLDDTARSDLAGILAENGLAGLVSARNPLDLTPMASEKAYDDVCRWALGQEAVGCLVVGCVPLAPTLATTGKGLDGPQAFPALFQNWSSMSKKPVVFVVDSGPLYDELVERVRQIGVPVFRTADAAVRQLGTYLRHKAGAQEQT